MTFPEEYRDNLTGFWRSDVFFNYLNDKINERLRHEEKEPFALLILDIDHFKDLNDTHGHLCGDKALKFFSLKIRNACENYFPDTSFLVRYGGDEMVVVLDKIGGEEAEEFAKKLVSEIEHGKFNFQDYEMSLKASVGISSFPEDSTESRDLFEKADRALYVSKKLHKHKVVLAKQAPRLDLNLKLKKLCLFLMLTAFLSGLTYGGYVLVRGPMIPVVVTLKSGGSITGKIVYEDEQSIVLRPSLLTGKAKTVILKKDILETKKLSFWNR